MAGRTTPKKETVEVAEDANAPVPFDPTSITFDELDLLEEQGFDLANLGAMSSKTIKAYAFLVKHREDASFTWADAGGLTLGFLEGLTVANGNETRNA